VHELVGDRLQLLRGEQNQRGGGVPKVVKPYRRQACPLDEVVERVGQVGRGQRLAVLVCEDPSAGRDPGRGELTALQ
jgi:hypothetical protein